MKFNDDKHGSALLVTLLVVSLLLVMTLSLVAVVRMDLREVTQYQQLYQARANARLGAELAVARLQELTGADTRVTFAAESDASLDPSVLRHMSRRTQHWTGVRDAALLNPSESGLNPGRGELLGWLVSGERLPSGSSVPAEGAFDPLTGRSPLTTQAWAGARLPGSGFAKVVGAGSVLEDSASGHPDFVAVPKVGVGDNGFYGWWAADEGVKARVNLGDRFLLDGDASTDALRHVTVPRAGSELFLPGYTPGSEAQQEEMDKVVSARSLNHLSFAPVSTPNYSASRELFHDVSLVSSGLAANVRYGGLQRDLTAVFQEASGNGGQPGGQQWERLLDYQSLQMNRAIHLPRNAGGIRPDQNRSELRARMFPHLTHASIGDDFGGPSWNHLVTWVNTRELNPTFEVRQNRIDNQGLWPVVAKLELSRYITFDRKVSPTRLYYIIVPKIVLWNPYNVPLRFPGNTMHMRWLDGIESFPNDTLDLVVSREDEFYYLTGLKLPLIGDNDGRNHVAGTALWNAAYSFDFILEGGEIPPGAAKVFTMTRTHRYTTGLTTLEDSWNAAGNNLKDGVLLNVIDRSRLNVPVLSSTPSPGNYGVYLEVDLNEFIQKTAGNKPTSWPDSLIHEDLKANGLNGFTLEASGGGESSRVRFTTDGDSDRFVFELAGTQNRLSTNVKFHLRGGQARNADIMMRGMQFVAATFDYDPEDYLFTPGSDEIPDDLPVLFHFAFGLRLPYNFSLERPGVEPNRIAPAPLFASGNPLTGKFNVSKIDRGNGYQGVNSYVAMILQKSDDLQFTTHDGKSYAYIGYSDHPAEISGSFDEPYPRMILSEIPGTALALEGFEEITSPASLQHANLRSFNNELRNTHEADLFFRWNFHGGNLGPSHPIGNSMADPYIAPDTVHRWGWQGFEYPDNNAIGGGLKASHYDFSYLLNQVLWDDFVFTGWANSRLLWRSPAWNTDRSRIERDFDTSAAEMRTLGAFNVNSTSVRAWASLLRAFEGLDVGGEDGGDERSPLSRFNDRYGDPFDPATTNRASEFGFARENNFTGYRRLTRREIYDEDTGTGLAAEIVRQVKARGPFLSLGDFVNRALLPPGNDPDGHRLSGAVQRAIDDSGINAAQHQNSLDSRSHISIADLGDPSRWPSDRFYLDHKFGAATRGAPGYFTQADLLSRIGPVLRVRSDTFLIRSYGEVTDGNGNPLSKAWCEVVVQREPEYLDALDEPDVLPVDLEQPVNRLLGRRYTVVAFRWLGEDEL
ncbi:MAG: hypothetical protein JJU05_07960 [Verrucomicrobia bacterium]|nr:hypothetical protein [Verrucomicrobiota bacterium]MCH8527508.1 hypothetical protein [Kiritimatiellia bacterium]